ncbi:MAG: guanine deaminase, partial [Pseudomonadota bacterium]|nr:guanine deaminase [Pseudomonadota bacterium]
MGEERSYRFNEKGALVIGDDGLIAWAGDAAELPEEHRGLPSDDHGACLVMPGFIDAHLHFPQYRMI